MLLLCDCDGANEIGDRIRRNPELHHSDINRQWLYKTDTRTENAYFSSEFSIPEVHVRGSKRAGVKNSSNS